MIKHFQSHYKLNIDCPIQKFHVQESLYSPGYPCLATWRHGRIGKLTRYQSGPNERSGHIMTQVD